MTAAISTEALRKSYGRVQALDGLDLTVEPGTVFGFLGPNGAGKTTTIRILTGLAKASGGRAWVAGVAVGADRQALARRIGFLPEEPAFYGWMTPREYLDFVGQTFSLPAGDRAARVKELLALVGLEEAAKRRIGGFSRGMRQRLGIAQALVNRPEVIFLDEPVSALDPAGRREVLELIERLRGHSTVFMSTHILADVERVCDSVGILARGRLVTEARRDDLLARYATPAFDLECDGDCGAALRAWGDSLAREPWVASVAYSGGAAHVVVRDTQRAKRELLPSALAAGLVVSRYETVRPSLEDIFLRLVGQEGEAA
jgi:ABC-2 type transport system ATP-binding protein